MSFNVPYQIDLEMLQSFDISTVTKLSLYSTDSYFSTSSVYDPKNLTITRLPLPTSAAGTVESLKKIFQNFKLNNWKFSADDIRQLGGNGNLRQIGLRHLSSEEAAINEQKNGMQDGCSLNLTFRKTESFYSPFENLNTKDNETIEELLPQYEYGINEFIFNSILDDIKLTQNVKTIGDFLQATQKTQFLLIKYYPFFKATDTDLWGEGLGRFPKKSITPNNIILLPKPNLEEFLRENQHRYIFGVEETRKMIVFLVKHYKKQMLDIIRDDKTKLDYEESSF